MIGEDPRGENHSGLTAGSSEMDVRCRRSVVLFVRVGLTLLVGLLSVHPERQYLNEWAVEVPGGSRAARSIADELGYQLVRQVSTGVSPSYLSWCSCKELRRFRHQSSSGFITNIRREVKSLKHEHLSLLYLFTHSD